MNKIINKNVFILLIIILSIIPVFSLLNPGLPITHDGQDHVARIANFYQNLTEGNIIPRWAGNLNWGYGHPILEFLYPLPSYFASVFSLFGIFSCGFCKNCFWTWNDFLFFLYVSLAFSICLKILGTVRSSAVHLCTLSVRRALCKRRYW